MGRPLFVGAPPPHIKRGLYLVAKTLSDPDHHLVTFQPTRRSCDGATEHLVGWSGGICPLGVHEKLALTSISIQSTKMEAETGLSFEGCPYWAWFRGKPKENH